MFSKSAVLHPVSRSGAVQSHGTKKKVKDPNEKYVEVGKTVVGGDEIVGGETI